MKKRNALCWIVVSLFAILLMGADCGQGLALYMPDDELSYAASAGKTGEIRHIVQREGRVNRTDRFGQTPLHAAAHNCQDSSVTTLVALGAYVNATAHNGDHPLHKAATKIGCTHALGELLHAGADVNARGEYGETALVKAIRFALADNAQLLLNNSADPRIQSHNGRDAFGTLQQAMRDAEEDLRRAVQHELEYQAECLRRHPANYRFCSSGSTQATYRAKIDALKRIQNMLNR